MVCMACVRAHFIPQLPLQPTSPFRTQITFLTSLATGLSLVWVTAATWCCHQELQVHCDTHVEETCRKFCVELICSSSSTRYQNLSCCFTTPSGCTVLQLQIIRHANSMKPNAGSGSFLQNQFVPKAALIFFAEFINASKLWPLKKGWNSLKRENTPWNNTWFSNSDAVLLKQSCGAAHSKFLYWTGEQMLHKLSSVVGWAAPSHQSQQILWNTPWTWNHPGDNSSKSEWEHICAMVPRYLCCLHSLICWDDDKI